MKQVESWKDRDMIWEGQYVARCIDLLQMVRSDFLN